VSKKYMDFKLAQNCTEERKYKERIKEEDNHIYRHFRGGIGRKKYAAK
jgi:hypothetical protein